MGVVSPLHRVIDAGRWDAERLLGRLIVVIHAAFLDAGFVPVHQRPRKAGPVPRQAGRTASALSLRYAAPQLLLHRPEETIVELRIRAHGGRHLILYVQCEAWPVDRCVLVDALAAAPLVSRGLDGTARALRSDARLAGLWRRLSDGLCRRALVETCRRNGVELEPNFMSLPGDARAAILARLTDGVDLASVQCACAGLRRLVAERDRELWKPRYEALLRHVPTPSRLLPDYSSHSPETSWKERYVRARRRLPPTSLLARYVRFNFQNRIFGVRARMMRQEWQDIMGTYNYKLYRFIPPFYNPSEPRRRIGVDEEEPELEADEVAERRDRTAAERGKRAARRCRTPPFRGHEKRQHGGGAIHSPSSRYRWKHR